MLRRKAPEKKERKKQGEMGTNNTCPKRKSKYPVEENVEILCHVLRLFVERWRDGEMERCGGDVGKWK